MVKISSSVARRDPRDVEAVKSELRVNGWREAGTLSNRVIYMENSGLSITLIDGPIGTVIIPSGPIRGRVFGSSGFSLGLMDNSGGILEGGVTSTTGTGFSPGSRIKSLLSRNQQPNPVPASDESETEQSSSSSSTEDNNNGGTQESVSRERDENPEPPRRTNKQEFV